MDIKADIKTNRCSRENDFLAIGFGGTVSALLNRSTCCHGEYE